MRESIGKIRNFCNFWPMSRRISEMVKDVGLRKIGREPKLHWLAER